MRIEDLVERYPKLFHMAASGAWPSIRKLGLLHTEGLLTTFEVEEPLRTQLLAQRRPVSTSIRHPSHGTAVVRDQHPLRVSQLERCLTDMSVEEWLRLLNSMVFFWLVEDKLESMMGARPYRDLEHDVLIVDTEKLVTDYLDEVRLSPINSGATLYNPPTRGRSTFYPIADFPFEERRFRGKNAVIELAVVGGTSGIESSVIRVERRKAGGNVLGVLYER